MANDMAGNLAGDMGKATADDKFGPISTVEVRDIKPFALATLLPVPLLIIGSLAGGLWAVLALAYLTVFTYAADAIAGDAENAPDTAEFPTADRLSVALGFLHFALLTLALWTLSQRAGWLGWSWPVVFVAFGLYFGQVSNSNAHELIHRGDRDLRRLGAWVYISLFFGHHSSAHRLIHHRYVATPDDPNTAEFGENFYEFAVRAWPGAFVAGYEMESQKRRLKGEKAGRFSHPYFGYLAGSALCLFIAFLLFGLGGVLVYVLLAAYAQMQLLLSDYVQHYGLLRTRLPEGGYEPAGPAHSWDAPHRFSGWLMLHAPRHSDHHAHPARPYPELQLHDRDQGPVLPYSLPVMGAIALVPKLWRRVMHPRLIRWRTEAANRAAA